MQNKKQLKSLINDAKQVYSVRTMFLTDKPMKTGLEAKFEYLIRDALELLAISCNKKETETEDKAIELLGECEGYIGALKGYSYLLTVF